MLKKLKSLFKREKHPEKLLGKLLKKKNVIGYCWHEHETKGKCVQVFVTRKEEPAALLKKDLIPKEIKGHPTDVVEIQIPKALSQKCPAKKP